MDCVKCGNRVDPYHNQKDLNICCGCNYWQHRVNEINRGNSRIAILEKDGKPTCYYIGNENPRDGWVGFSGRKFLIEFLDGRYKEETIIETTNLWHNGIVPEHFRDELPINARFV